MKAALFGFAATIVMVAGSIFLQGSANRAHRGNESRSHPAAGDAFPYLDGDDIRRCPYLDSQAGAFRDDAPPLEDDQEGEDPETGCPYLQEHRTPDVRQESDQNLQLFRMV